MKKRPFFVGVQIFLISTLLALSVSGCSATKKGAGGTPESEPPPIPPRSTFVMDFSDFTESKISAGPQAAPSVVRLSLDSGPAPAAAPLGALGDRANWGYAALNVGFWNLAGFIGLAIPVTAFVESIKQQPLKQPDNSWVWTYSITVQEITYTAELHGKYIDSGVRWDMYITKQDEYTDFLWYYGESDLGSTKGHWVLKERPAKPNDFLRIDWRRNPATETGDIKYTNIVPGGPENGGYISFDVSQEKPFDRAYTIFNKGKNQTTFIEWDSLTKAGRVKDRLHFGNDLWYCWDAALKNTQCP